jgi:hypothetical protein
MGWFLSNPWFEEQLFGAKITCNYTIQSHKEWESEPAAFSSDNLQLIRACPKHALPTM